MKIKKIKFPSNKRIGRIDLGNIVITDKSTIPVSASTIPVNQAIKALVKAMSDGEFSNLPRKELEDGTGTP